MAITTATVGTADTTVFTSTNETAISIMSFCNTSAAQVTISIMVVPAGDTPSDANTLVKNLEIAPGDSFVVYQGGEKLILDNGDYVSAIADTASAVTAITSFIQV